MFLIICTMFFACTPNLKQVSVADFEQFVQATGYVTDAEKYDWSIVQEDVDNFQLLFGIDWRCPNGLDKALPGYPITQVSFQDAQAYCEWAETRLPSYEEYWQLSQKDSRPIIENMPFIFPIDQANIIGNVWEFTNTTRANGELRLAGGSYLCSPNSCNGTNPLRALFVDKTTGNSHISFAIVEE